GFRMEVRAHDPFLERSGWPAGDVAPAPDLHAALGLADCISVHVPRGEKPILGPAEFAAMKPGVILANTSRGGVVSEAALAEALASGHVGAAGIDVFDAEPPDGRCPLAAFDNVILTPHIAGITNECAERMAIDSVENALAYLDGTIDPGLVVNREHALVRKPAT
ncbi:MAG: NAD(P)-dependent oxidoreductase, partial [Albidovulum sp.]